MKHVLVVLGIGLALSFCNLANKLHGNKNSSSGTNSSSSGSSDSGGAVAEHGQANAAQAAALAGGSELKWEQQGMSWTLPPGWTEVSNESKSLSWRSGGADGVSLNVNISPMSEDFPVEASINANYEGQKTRAKNGEVDELKWVEIDGVKGVQFREAKPEKPDGFRRLQWIAFRKYAGQVQMINLMLATNGKGYDTHKDAMYGVLYSTKLVH